MKFILPSFVAALTCIASIGQGDNTIGATETVSEASQWKPTHPDGDTPIQRMLSLAYTDSLPAFDRVELYALSMPKPFSDEEPKREPTKNTFPVRPYFAHADIHAHVTLSGKVSEEIGSRWRSLAFDRLGGAFCHNPVYGLRFYRNDLLLFETTVCWECQNFYLPRYDVEKRQFLHGWYGFASNSTSKALLALFRRELPHPKLSDTPKAGGR